MPPDWMLITRETLQALGLETLQQHVEPQTAGHLKSIPRAIVAVFHGNMLVAGYFVPIQFEAVIRRAMECNGAPGPMLKPDGTHAECTLSTLLDLSQVKSIFEDACVIELPDLLTGPLGSNLRNEVAFGLATERGFFSLDFVYIWWLFLKNVTRSAHLFITRQHGAQALPTGPPNEASTP